VANGQVISRVREHHRHQEFLDFLRQIDKQTPPDLDRKRSMNRALEPEAHA
jgi:putative transposase